eukprot:920951-Amorphochlora_amoeboformis.AAC.1
MDSERQTMEPAHRGPESKESYTVLSRQSDNLKQSGSRNVNPKSKGRGTKKSKRTKKTKRDSLPPLRPNQGINTIHTRIDMYQRLPTGTQNLSNSSREEMLSRLARRSGAKKKASKKEEGRRISVPRWRGSQGGKQ